MKIVLHNTPLIVSFRFGDHSHNKVAFATEQFSLGQNIMLS